MKVVRGTGREGRQRDLRGRAELNGLYLLLWIRMKLILSYLRGGGLARKPRLQLSEEKRQPRWVRNGRPCPRPVY